MSRNDAAFSNPPSFDTIPHIRNSQKAQLLKRTNSRKIEIYVLESEFPHCALPLNYFDLAQDRADTGRTGVVVEISRC